MKEGRFLVLAGDGDGNEIKANWQIQQYLCTGEAFPRHFTGHLGESCQTNMIVDGDEHSVEVASLFLF